MATIPFPGAPRCHCAHSLAAPQPAACVSWNRGAYARSAGLRVQCSSGDVQKAASRASNGSAAPGPSSEATKAASRASSSARAAPGPSSDAESSDDGSDYESEGNFLYPPAQRSTIKSSWNLLMRWSRARLRERKNGSEDDALGRTNKVRAHSCHNVRVDIFFALTAAAPRWVRACQYCSMQQAQEPS